MKQIPNFFTLLNLLFGCIAIVLIMQTGDPIVDYKIEEGIWFPYYSENISLGALFIFAAALVDFLDGFLARALKAGSAMGAQLDSLSDVVSFGVAPGMILFQHLRLGYTQMEDGMNTPMLLLLPAFLFTAAVAWRLAKFNISTDQSDSFRGVPSPAAALVVASFPLIVWYKYFDLQYYFINTWIMYAVIILLAYLMVCNKRFLAFKFKDFSFQNNMSKYLLLIIAVISIVFLKWLAVPVIFLLYVVTSLLSKHDVVLKHENEKELTDITV
jgi:CDP-diacylglycerol---serine O-phosphatidyltransferase